MGSVDDTDKRGHARIAITRAAAQRGLSTDLNLLSERWNTVARLGTSGVIAKAATFPSLARKDPAFWFQQEVDVCYRLSEGGAPVHRPLPDQQPICDIDGLPITFWYDVTGEMGEASESELVSSLVDLHRAAATFRSISRGLVPSRATLRTSCLSCTIERGMTHQY